MALTRDVRYSGQRYEKPPHRCQAPGADAALTSFIVEAVAGCHRVGRARMRRGVSADRGVESVNSPLRGWDGNKIPPEVDFFHSKERVWTGTTLEDEWRRELFSVYTIENNRVNSQTLKKICLGADFAVNLALLS